VVRFVFRFSSLWSGGNVELAGCAEGFLLLAQNGVEDERFRGCHVCNREFSARNVRLERFSAKWSPSLSLPYRSPAFRSLLPSLSL
jgi:hypothetical protein